MAELPTGWSKPYRMLLWREWNIPPNLPLPTCLVVWSMHHHPTLTLFSRRCHTSRQFYPLTCNFTSSQHLSSGPVMGTALNKSFFDLVACPPSCRSMTVLEIWWKLMVFDVLVGAAFSGLTSITNGKALVRSMRAYRMMTAALLLWFPQLLPRHSKISVSILTQLGNTQPVGCGLIASYGLRTLRTNSNVLSADVIIFCSSTATSKCYPSSSQLATGNTLDTLRGTWWNCSTCSQMMPTWISWQVLMSVVINQAHGILQTSLESKHTSRWVTCQVVWRD